MCGAAEFAVGILQPRTVTTSAHHQRIAKPEEAESEQLQKRLRPAKSINSKTDD
jgi:hypothetical protein